MIRLKISLVCLFLIITLVLPNKAIAQDTLITLDQCYELSKRNYPLIATSELVSKTSEYNVSNVKSGYLPSITILAQFTTQSDVTNLPVSIPNMSIPEIDRNQYKAYAEVSQIVYDGGSIRNQKKIIEAQTEVDLKSLEVELYKVRERINQLYFGILLLDGQIQQVELLKKDILTGIEKSGSAYENGILLKSNVDALQAELLKTKQRIIELNSGRKAYLQMLGLFINRQLPENITLEVPAVLSIDKSIKRPEIELFLARANILSAQSKVITSKNLPKLNLFLQGGYGSPALNMLDPDADTYYITGLRLAWPLTGFYNNHRDKLINSLAMKNIESQQETFIFNTNIQLSQQSVELDKLAQLVQTDDEIIALREDISKASLLQLENGVITSADYVREVTATENARQSKLIHKLQFLMTQHNYQIISGNQ